MLAWRRLNMHSDTMNQSRTWVTVVQSVTAGAITVLAVRGQVPQTVAVTLVAALSTAVSVEARKRVAALRLNGLSDSAQRFVWTCVNAAMGALAGVTVFDQGTGAAVGMAVLTAAMSIVMGAGRESLEP